MANKNQAVNTTTNEKKKKTQQKKTKYEKFFLNTHGYICIFMFGILNNHNQYLWDYVYWL